MRPGRSVCASVGRGSLPQAVRACVLTSLTGCYVCKVVTNTTRQLLVLDLDETLIHSADEPLQWPADFQFDRFQVYLRPGLDSFLRRALELFNVAVWSSASDDYVAQLVARIFPDPTALAFIWGRSRNTLRRNVELDEYYHVKDLRKVKRLGYSLERILVVDDSREKVERNYGNAICVRPFEGDPSDRELDLLGRYLERFPSLANVRTIEKRGWWREVE